MSYSETILINLGAAQTGLTLQAQLYTPGTLTTVGDPITDGFVEKGLGTYAWTNPTDWDDDAHYDLKFQKVGDTSIAAWTTINPRFATRTEATADKQAILTAIAGISGGSGGTGANAVHIAITDGTDPLEGVTVRVTKGAESFVLSTDSSGRAGGEAGFSLDNGTWEVRATLPLYTLAVQALVVDGVEDVTYSMTSQSYTPNPEPELVNGEYIAIVNGEKVAGEEIYLELVQAPTAGVNATGIAAVDQRTVTSGIDGVTEIDDLIVGASYSLRIGGTTSKSWIFKVPDDADDSVSRVRINSFIGFTS